MPSRLTLADRSDSPRFKLIVQNSRGLAALRALDELQLGIAFLQGDIDVDGDFLSCLDLRAVFTDRHPLQSLQRFLVPLLLGQRRGDIAWVPKHYDFGNDFYFAFLDKRYGLYSQALYLANDETLERAVTNKLEYIVDICRLAPESHVLDVGGGWGRIEKSFAEGRSNRRCSRSRTSSSSTCRTGARVVGCRGASARCMKAFSPTSRGSSTTPLFSWG